MWSSEGDGSYIELDQELKHRPAIVAGVGSYSVSPCPNRVHQFQHSYGPMMGTIQFMNQIIN